jgi:hypothetical protein
VRKLLCIVFEYDWKGFAAMQGCMSQVQQPLLMQDLIEGPHEHAAEQPHGSRRRLREASRTSSVHVFDDMHGVGVKDDEFQLRTTVRKWVQKQRRDFQYKRQTYRIQDWLGQVFPCLSWLIGYSVCSLTDFSL